MEGLLRRQTGLCALIELLRDSLSLFVETGIETAIHEVKRTNTNRLFVFFRESSWDRFLCLWTQKNKLTRAIFVFIIPSNTGKEVIENI